LKKTQATERYDIVLNGENIEGKIRNLEVAKWVSPVARISGVRSIFGKTATKHSGAKRRGDGRQGYWHRGVGRRGVENIYDCKA
jgi:cytidylate kinase